MKPEFALYLSVEGITLLHHATDGWRSVGNVTLDVEDLAAELEKLKETAQELSPKDLRCKIVIPSEQIRYLSLPTGSFEGETRREMARAALEGATPYDVADLVFDLSFDADQTHVAAVARETLEEAEAFARSYGFDPVSFVAAPDNQGFAGEPNFGPDSETDDSNEPKGEPEPHLDDTPEANETALEHEPVGRDFDETDFATASSPIASDGQTDPITVDAPVEDSASVGFASRRKKPSERPGAPPLAGVSRDIPAPVDLEPEQAPPSDPPLEQASEPAETMASVSVTAPALEVPVFAADGGPEDSNQDLVADPSPSRFLSRRKPKDPDPVEPHKSGPIVPAPSAQSFETETETERMTVFGARDNSIVGGKPRHLGLMLTGGLLVILAAVAIWSALFQDDRIAGDPETPAVETTRADPSNVRAPDVQTTAPDIAAAPEDVTSRQPSGAQTDPSEDLQTPDTPVTDAALPQSADAVNSQNRLDDEALYAVSGIWQAAPTAPLPPEVIELEDLYRVSIDPRDLSQDALALPPAPGYDTDRIVASVATPVAAGTAFALDSRGLVTPSENGTLNPDGILIYRGSPSLVPPETPTRFEADPEEEANIQRDRLAAFRPRPRPGDLVEQNERAQLGGLTRSELGNVRPKLRPKNVKTEAEADETPTAQAIVVSRMPKLRPSGFDKKVQSASRQAPAANAQVAAAPAPAQVAPRTVTPRIPSSASVARRATLDNAINLRRVNLIGVYGTPSNRRALVRLPSGRYKKVKVGDKVDGGRILAIGDSELRYQKGGRNVTLKIPSG